MLSGTVEEERKSQERGNLTCAAQGYLFTKGKYSTVHNDNGMPMEQHVSVTVCVRPSLINSPIAAIFFSSLSESSLSGKETGLGGGNNKLTSTN